MRSTRTGLLALLAFSPLGGQLPAAPHTLEDKFGRDEIDTDKPSLTSLTPAHCYYDAMLSSGVTTYPNAFLYRALRDLAQLELAAGNLPEAATRETEIVNPTQARVATANRVVSLARGLEQADKSKPGIAETKAIAEEGFIYGLPS